MHDSLICASPERQQHSVVACQCALSALRRQTFEILVYMVLLPMFVSHICSRSKDLLKMLMRNRRWILRCGLGTWAASSASHSCVDKASEGRCIPMRMLPFCSFSVGKSDKKLLAVTRGTSVSQNEFSLGSFNPMCTRLYCTWNA